MTEQERQKRAKVIRASYQSGESVKKLARQHSISESYVKDIIYNRCQPDGDYTPVRKVKSTALVSEILRLRKSGVSFRDIAHLLGVRENARPFSESSIRMAVYKYQRGDLDEQIQANG